MFLPFFCVPPAGGRWWAGPKTRSRNCNKAGKTSRYCGRRFLYYRRLRARALRERQGGGSRVLPATGHKPPPALYECTCPEAVLHAEPRPAEAMPGPTTARYLFHRACWGLAG